MIGKVNQVDLESTLLGKANKQSVANALQRKANKVDLETALKTVKAVEQSMERLKMRD